MMITVAYKITGHMGSSSGFSLKLKHRKSGQHDVFRVSTE
jgi:hypothetical protein